MPDAAPPGHRYFKGQIFFEKKKKKKKPSKKAQTDPASIEDGHFLPKANDNKANSRVVSHVINRGHSIHFFCVEFFFRVDLFSGGQKLLLKVISHESVSLPLNMEAMFKLEFYGQVNSSNPYPAE